jgi:membrane-bound serine protease (ClpP class)
VFVFHFSPQPWSSIPPRRLFAQLGSFLLSALMMAAMALGDDKPATPPIASVVPLVSPLTDESLGQVRRTVLELQDRAVREDRRSFVILEITPGHSQFHHCYALADFLTAEPFSHLTTIAWVPETVSGHNVLIALACQEIVMSPTAALGDMGAGSALPADQQTIVKGIVARRRNAKVTESLAQALMDPSAALVQLTIDTGGLKETRLATAEEARKLQAAGTVIVDSKTISEQGSPTLISGAQARARDILAVRTAGSRRDVIDAYGLSLDALQELAPAAPLDKIAYIELHDMIDEVFASFAQRQIERAVQSDAKLIVFEIDSPGGLLWVCHDLSMTIATLGERGVRTVGYIPNEAYSGGAILAAGCDEIYMKPTAKIGNAIPIQMMGRIVLRAEEKALSGELELLRSLAKAKKRPPALLEKFADKDLEVFEVTNKKTGRKWYMSADEMQQYAEDWNPGPRVPEARPGIALMVDGERAHELLLAQRPVQDLSELKQRLGLAPDFQFRVVGRTWVDTLVFNLNGSLVTGLLFFLAIVCIYIEMATMTGFFGILSAVCFGIFFWSKVMGGTATGLEIALFAIGAGCLALEIFVIPGFGVFGVSGILLVLASLIMASQTFTGFDLEYDLARAGRTFATLGAALVAVTIASFFLSQHLHRIPFLRDLVLAGPAPGEPAPGEPRLRPEYTGPEAALLGMRGTAVTILRPAGKARIEGRMVDVVSDGPFIQEGTDVTVIQVAKNRIVVRETEQV